MNRLLLQDPEEDDGLRAIRLAVGATIGILTIAFGSAVYFYDPPPIPDDGIVRICRQIPAPSESVELATEIVSADSKTTVLTTYRTDASDQELWLFYYRIMARRGWNQIRAEVQTFSGESVVVSILPKRGTAEYVLKCAEHRTSFGIYDL